VLATTIVREARDEILRDVVITDVEVTSDLSVARVYWHPLPGVTAADPEAAQAAFDRAAGFFRRRVGEVIRARQTPELRFLYDDALDRGRRVDDILVKIAAERPEETTDRETVEARAADAGEEGDADSDDGEAGFDDGEADEGEQRS
jgi:ribosome-binding factor A